jgi:hypothetical protein
MALITVQDVSVEEVKKGRNNYQVALVVYTNNKGENKEKKVVSFSNPAVFATVKDAKSGQQYEVEYAKDDPYYNWASIKLASESAAAPKSAPTGGKVTGSNYETAEERVKRQLMIVRQSSISNALEYMKNTNNQDFGVTDLLGIAQEFVDFVYMDEEVGLAEVRGNDQGVSED